MLSAVVYRLLAELTKGILSRQLGRVSLTQANRPVVKPMPVLRVGLPEVRLDLGTIRRPKIAHKASMFEKASRLTPG